MACQNIWQLRAQSVLQFPGMAYVGLMWIAANCSQISGYNQPNHWNCPNLKVHQNCSIGSGQLTGSLHPQCALPFRWLFLGSLPSFASLSPQPMPLSLHSSVDFSLYSSVDSSAFSSVHFLSWRWRRKHRTSMPIVASGSHCDFDQNAVFYTFLIHFWLFGWFRWFQCILVSSRYITAVWMPV